ncbi:RteC domain-containing protein [uncultured Draconibacterium sp.]|uniref:RteC domain-containing protein n=1 Tax=uncultured Draconibacterium sp. TaxID=1573823 RepID=UPI0025E333D1|nr:RteC domain-containing protein [uncultured Draconibacterium sp.]
MIKNKSTRLLLELNNELTLLKIRELDTIKQASMAIGVCRDTLSVVKELVISNSFENELEELYFFKKIKPEFFSKLIYYTEILRIETHRPHSNRKFQIKYLKGEFSKSQEYMKSNYEFCQYYKGGQTHLDEKYFKRNGHGAPSANGNYSHFVNPEFSTSHDEVVAYIIAHEGLERYLDCEIIKLRKNKQPVLAKDLKGKSVIKWTAPKVALIELIYALHSHNCFNNGNIDVIEIIRFFEQILDIELNKSYRTFIDIKERQNEKTKFLLELQKALRKRLDDLDKLN